MRQFFKDIKNLFIGLFTVGKHLTRHAITLQYPTEKWPMPERSRGVVVLLSDKETGELNCTVCMLCARSCPTGAIKIDQHRNEETKKRELDDFVIDFQICCFCGLCEEACNFAAIKMAPKYEFSTLNRDDMIWHTDKLQEVGRDVPYEKPVKKKPAKAAGKGKPKPAGKPAEKPGSEKKEKPAEEKEEGKAEEKVEKKPEETKADKPAEDVGAKGVEEKPVEKPEEKEEEKKPADEVGAKGVGEKPVGNEDKKEESSDDEEKK